MALGATLRMVVGAVILVLLEGVLVTWAWNLTLPYLFTSVPFITYGHGIGLAIVGNLLFGRSFLG